MIKRAIIVLLGLGLAVIAGAPFLSADALSSARQSPGTLAPPCQNHDPDVRVRVDMKHADSKVNKSATVPEIFVACQDDRVTWEIHDPSILSFEVDFDTENPFNGGGKFSDSAPTSGTVKSPGLASADKFKYLKYKLTIRFRNGSSQVIDPGGVIMGP